MTVAELIEELQKFPGHHVAIVAHDDAGLPAYPLTASESFIHDVRAGEQCSVIIDAATRPWE